MRIWYDGVSGETQVISATHKPFPSLSLGTIANPGTDLAIEIISTSKDRAGFLDLRIEILFNHDDGAGFLDLNANSVAWKIS